MPLYTSFVYICVFINTRDSHTLCGNGTRAVLSRNAAGVLTRRNMGKEADYGLLRL